MKPLRRLDLEIQDLTLDALLARQALRNRDKPYLLFEQETYSYRQTEDLTRRLADGLAALGMRKGEHVAVFAGNAAETLFMHMALGRLGAVSCAINTAAKGELLTYFLDLADCTAIVVDGPGLERYREVAASLPSIRRIVVLPDAEGRETNLSPGPDSASYRDLLQIGGPVRREPVHPEGMHGIFFTSGTTGPSKGIVATSAQILSFAAGRVEYLGMRADDVVYTCLPLFHGNALHTAAFAALIADATLVLSRRFSATSFWDEIRRYKVTNLNLLSSMTDILWGRPPAEDDSRHSVRQCTMVPVPAFALEFERRFGLKIVSSYALSDFGQGTFLQPDHPAGKFRSAGLPRPGVEIRIVDDAGMAVEAGRAGEICLRADSAALGSRSYYKMPDLTAEMNRDGWFHTGDRGYLDGDGYLYFVDRKKDAIRRRGENISSWEVEQAIAAHPAVAEVAVVPVPSGMSEDEVVAFVVSAADSAPPPEELVRFCARNLAYFMVPRYIAFVDALPKTATEKVQKQVLREWALRDRDLFWDREKSGVALAR